MSERRAVLILSAEDDPATTIVPRLKEAGADLERIFLLAAVRERRGGKEGAVVERPVSLEDDLVHVEKVLKDHPEIALVIVDPISAYSGRVDTHIDAEVRGFLAPLAALASKYDVAVVLIVHLNKAPHGKALYRPGGSIAFVAAPRASYVLAEDPKEERRRLLLSLKFNLGQRPDGRAFRLVAGEETGVPRLLWDPDPVQTRADEVLHSQKETSADEVEAWLRTRLEEGPCAASEVLEEGAEKGFSAARIHRAKDRLGVRHRKQGFQGGSIWSLGEGEEDPEEEDPADEDEDPATPKPRSLESLANSGSNPKDLCDETSRSLADPRIEADDASDSNDRNSESPPSLGKKAELASPSKDLTLGGKGRPWSRGEAFA